ncbi:MAG: hypothetical protein J6A15_00195 [Clostridia bacterium]|nr:hypothetical protein [Clostridia bacterium]
MNYREKIRKAIECPQFGNGHYGEWGALNLEQRKYIKRLLDELDSADNYIKKLYLENQKQKDKIDGIYEERTYLYNKLSVENEQLNSLVNSYQEEIRQLKKQLEDIKQELTDERDENYKLSELWCNSRIKVRDLETQQKEFIKYMNDIIEDLETEDVDDEELKGYLLQRISTFKEILQKYKNIIGSDK